jgi:hypothetical protein
MKTSDSGWQYASHEQPVYAVGDVHGDLDAFVRILRGLHLIDGSGAWSGGRKTILLLGDLNDRGPDSFSVMNLAMDLEVQARAIGGSVFPLLGNHELLAAMADYRYMNSTEAAALARFQYGHGQGLDAVFRGGSPWAAWIRSRPTVLKVDSTLFVHAAVDAWCSRYSPPQVNSLVQQWAAFLQGIAEQPEEATFELITGDDSPLWSEAFAVSSRSDPDASRKRRSLTLILDSLGCERVVVGHRPTTLLDYRIVHPHPVFGDAVAMIDTGISCVFRGRLSAFAMSGKSTEQHYFPRGAGELPLTQALRQQYACRYATHLRCAPSA